MEYKELEKYSEELIIKLNKILNKDSNEKINNKENKELDLWYEKSEKVKTEKYKILKPLCPEDRNKLARKHPLWITEYDLYKSQFTYLDFCIPQPNEPVIVFTKVEKNTTNSLKHFYYFGGVVLRINMKYYHDLQHIENYTTNQESMKNMHLASKMGIEYIGEFKRIDLSDNTQWVFIGTRWWMDNEVLMLNFGNHLKEADMFCDIMDNNKLF